MRLDYYNEILIGIPKSDLHKLQMAQKSLARGIGKANKYLPATYP